MKDIASYGNQAAFLFIPPLFENEAEYNEFKARHAANKAPRGDISAYTGRAYLGIDAGSTTVKAVVIGENGEILDSVYRGNSGNPVPIIREYLLELFHQYPALRFAAAAVTGYGEELLRNAFELDYGIVETVAHFTAAKHFLPDVDFVIDIGGQDMKCFKIRRRRH